MAGTSALKRNMANSLEALRRAETLLVEGRDTEAKEIYAALKMLPDFSSVSLFRLGEICNRQGDPVTSYDCHVEAFRRDARLASRILSAGRKHYRYEFRPVSEVPVTECPLCHAPAMPRWAFNMVSNDDFDKGFNPVRLWMHCGECRHVFAGSRPEKLGDILRATANSQYEIPNLNLLAHLGRILAQIRRIAPGSRFLEVGVGAGEMLAAAREFDFEVWGLEIRPAHAERVSRLLGIPIRCEDFLEHEPDRPYDVICMGDVLEHMTDPVAAVRAAAGMLAANGVLWISTPNFESSHSVLLGDRDPMKRVCEHLNYFSRHSIETLLGASGFRTVDYQISFHYAGSMEITAVKAHP